MTETREAGVETFHPLLGVPKTHDDAGLHFERRRILRKTDCTVSPLPEFQWLIESMEDARWADLSVEQVVEALEELKQLRRAKAGKSMGTVWNDYQKWCRKEKDRER